MCLCVVELGGGWRGVEPSRNPFRIGTTVDYCWNSCNQNTTCMRFCLCVFKWVCVSGCNFNNSPPSYAQKRRAHTHSHQQGLQCVFVPAQLHTFTCACVCVNLCMRCVSQAESYYIILNYNKAENVTACDLIFNESTTTSQLRRELCVCYMLCRSVCVCFPLIAPSDRSITVEVYVIIYSKRPCENTQTHTIITPRDESWLNVYCVCL